MEFLRFGSRIPGAYWGCCAVCIIQNFKFDPSEKASIQVVHGDSGAPMMDGKEFKFLGPTYEDIFRARLRIGTFSDRDMPNHAFIAVLTEGQTRGGVGAKWLKILKEEGFEFLRTIDNSVYTGDTVPSPDLDQPGYPRKNYVFGMFRNIGNAGVEDQFTPPEEWVKLEGGITGAAEYVGEFSKSLTQQHREYHYKRWEEIGPAKFLTRNEVKEAGAPVILSGLLPEFQPEEEEARKKKKQAKEKQVPAMPSAFPVKEACVAA